MQQPMPATSRRTPHSTPPRDVIEYHERLTAASMAALVLPGNMTMTEHHAAVDRNPAVMALRRDADRKRAARLPDVEARRAERGLARSQHDAAIAAAQAHYRLCQQQESRIRAEHLRDAQAHRALQRRITNLKWRD